VKFLLVTDLDNTLVGDDRATMTLNQRLVALRHHFYLVYATGRSLSSFQQLQQEFATTTGTQLLEPDYLVTGVGTEIYHQGQLDQDWAARLDQNWQRQAIALFLESFPALIPQPEAEQNPWKISYYLQPPDNSLNNSPDNFLDNSQVINNLRSQLTTAGLAAQVVFSSNEDVDILPCHGDKGQAVAYLMQKLKILPQSTLVCGDSGNDISLFQQQTLGVIVGNAQPELLDWHKTHAHNHRYLARSTHAHAIGEALSHFQLLTL
jgi:sucrose-6-phosphatase